MQQRKRFNYLSNQQRTLNSQDNSQILKKFITSNTNHSNKYQTDSKPTQFGSIAQQTLNASSRKSSITRNHINADPLTEISLGLNHNTNVINGLNQTSQQKSLQSSRVTSSIMTNNKQNVFASISQTFAQKNQSAKKEYSQPSYPSAPVNQQKYKNRIKQLQKQNQLLLKNQQQKYMEMFTHLEKVQKILKQKQSIIQSLRSENSKLIQKQNECSYQKSIQKEKISSIVNLDEIKCSQQVQVQTQLVQQQQTKTIKQQPILSQKYSQTDLTNTQIQQLISKKFTYKSNNKASSKQQDVLKTSYRQKYESLFKKALQMQDQIYQLKQQLFDSQTQFKTLQQQFNTYKILNQIEKLNQRNE